MTLSPTALETGGRPLFVVSDLHLGKRAPFGFPADLEETLADAIDDATGQGAIIVLNGDILEADEGVTPFAALARYPRLLASLGAASTGGGVQYVIGNHDPAVGLLERVLPWSVVTSLLVDGTLLVVHGDVFDHGLHGTIAGRNNRLHALLQETLGVRVDLPLRLHPSLRNRLVVGAMGMLGEGARRVHPAVGASVDESFDYLASLEQETDPRFVLANLAAAALPRGVTAVLAGHTHQPGIADVGTVTYYNSGTWSEQLATVIHWDRGEGRVVDQRRGTTFGREAYARWQEREPWTSWWARSREELSPRRVLAEVVKTRLDSVEARPAARQLPCEDAGAREEETTMTVSFDETLSGTLRRAKGADLSVDVQLHGVTRADAARTGTADLEGTLDAPGFASRVPVFGALRIGPRIWEYELSFVADDGRPYRYVGQKRLRLLDLAASLSRLAGDVIDAHGRVAASLDLRFDLQRDLGPLVRSMTLSRPEPAPPSRAAAPVVDPWSWEPSKAACGVWVAVTGASGHIGHTLTRQLIDRGYSVLALVRDPRDARAATLRTLGAEVVGADVLSPSSLRAALEGRMLDGVVHTAAPFKLWSRDDQREIIEPTVTGMLNVLRAAEHAGVRRVVHTSAAGAAGHDATGRDALTEADWNRDSHSPYLVGTTEAERRAWSHAEARGLDLVTILPTAVIGPYFDRHTPVTRLFEDVVRGRHPLLPDFAHSWVDVRDVARAHILALETPSARGRYIVSARYESWHGMIARLQLCDPSIRSVRKLPSSLVGVIPVVDDLRARLLGAERLMTRAMIAELQDREPRYSSRRIESELGWTAIDFDRSVADTVRWMNRRAS